jgi:hypothetical protein
MNQAVAAFSSERPRALRAILPAGLTCGALDITAALLVYGSFGLGPLRLLQGIASGLLGSVAYEGGMATALLGLLCHFFIALSAATIFFATSRRFSFLVEHAVFSGALYGVAVYFFMARIVVPLSAARRGPFSFKFMFIGIVIRIFCVGLPIATLVRKYSYNRG